jgi:hypothetical protein
VSAVIVRFGEHVSAPDIDSMRAGLNAYGVVRETAPREFTVEVFRAPNLPRLLDQLMQWERYGFLKYSAGGLQSI